MCYSVVVLVLYIPVATKLSILPSLSCDLIFFLTSRQSEKKGIFYLYDFTLTRAYRNFRMIIFTQREFLVFTRLIFLIIHRLLN